MTSALQRLRAIFASKRDRAKAGFQHAGTLPGRAAGYVASQGQESFSRLRGRGDRLLKSAQAVPAYGAHAVRTHGFMGMSVDRAVSGGLNLLHAVAENALANHIEASSTRLQHQMARLVGMSQQYWTEHGLHTLDRSRGFAARHVAGPLTDKERVMIAEIHQGIRKQMADLHQLRSLRRVQDRSIQAAARSALAQMKARGREFRVGSFGEIDPDILAHIMPGAKPHELNRIQEEAMHEARAGRR